jgi:hypothetical protein
MPRWERRQRQYQVTPAEARPLARCSSTAFHLRLAQHDISLHSLGLKLPARSWFPYTHHRLTPCLPILQVSQALRECV